MYLAHVVISYHDMKQSELRRRARAINLVIEFKALCFTFHASINIERLPRALTLNVQAERA
ncbi:hypothetical protein B6N31_18610 [Dickeya fangzhongdai]|nr:hypothetical protein B6N31_18610 [Dickeya fangzhongdai]